MTILPAEQWDGELLFSDGLEKLCNICLFGTSLSRPQWVGWRHNLETNNQQKQTTAKRLRRRPRYVGYS